MSPTTFQNIYLTILELRKHLHGSRNYFDVNMDLCRMVFSVTGTYFTYNGLWDWLDANIGKVNS